MIGGIITAITAGAMVLVTLLGGRVTEENAWENLKKEWKKR